MRAICRLSQPRRETHDPRYGTQDWAPEVDNLANWISNITKREVSNTMKQSFHLRYVTASKGRNSFATANP